MTKTQALQIDLKKALEKLKEAVNLPAIVINQDATIKRFEFTFELAWKLMQSILRENDIEAYGVKNIFREAARLRLIDDPKIWFVFLENRNLTVHTYKEEIAQRVYQKAKEFISYVEELLKKAEKILDFR